MVHIYSMQTTTHRVVQPSTVASCDKTRDRLRIIFAAAFVPFAIASAYAAAPGPLLQDMVGTWNVQQRMWPGPGSAPTPLPAAMAHRQLIDGKYLQEDMESVAAGDSGKGAFRRDVFFNFNAVTRQYEYVSLDTRAPQLMAETSQPSSADLSGTLRLQGKSFLAPEWGSVKNIHFRYRLTVSTVKADSQIVRLYLTPQDVLPPKEFLAFEYVYTRSR